MGVFSYWLIPPAAVSNAAQLSGMLLFMLTEAMKFPLRVPLPPIHFPHHPIAAVVTLHETVSQR